jgi:hypothetical protein
MPESLCLPLSLSPCLFKPGSRRNLQRGTVALQFHTEKGPHRLEAQDTALSRRRQGFESPWGYWQLIQFSRIPHVKRVA